MSSLYKRGGYWVYQIYVKDPNTGYSKKVYKSLGKDLRPEDKPIIKKRLDEEYRNKFVKDSIYRPLYLHSTIERYLIQRQKEVDQGRRSPNTYRTDKTSLKVFEEYIKEHYGDIDIKKINKKTIVRWREDRFSDGVSSTTISVNMRTVSSFFSYFVKIDELESNPFIGVEIPTPVKRKEENISDIFQSLYDFTKEQIQKRLDGEVEERITRNHNKKKGLEWFNDNEWFIHYLWIMLNTGMRSGEVSILKWKQDKGDKGYTHSRSYCYLSDDLSKITVFFKRRKRELPIKQPVLDSLNLIPRVKKDGTPKKFVFESERTEKPYSVSLFGKLFKKLIQHLELDEDHTPHSIRHGYGSYLINNGGTLSQVSIILGHSEKEITEMYYLHSKSTDVSDTMDILYKK